MSESTIQSDTQTAEEIANVAAGVVTAVDPTVGAAVDAGLQGAEAVANAAEAAAAQPKDTGLGVAEAAVNAATAAAPAVAAAVDPNSEAAVTKEVGVFGAIENIVEGAIESVEKLF